MPNQGEQQYSSNERYEPGHKAEKERKDGKKVVGLLRNISIVLLHNV